MAKFYLISPVCGGGKTRPTQLLQRKGRGSCDDGGGGGGGGGVCVLGAQAPAAHYGSGRQLTHLPEFTPGTLSVRALFRRKYRQTGAITEVFKQHNEIKSNLAFRLRLIAQKKTK